MKNQILALLVLVTLFGFTITGAQAHTIQGPSHGSAHGLARGPGHGPGHFNQNRYYHNGLWYAYPGAWLVVPGFSIGFNL